MCIIYIGEIKLVFQAKFISFIFAIYKPIRLYIGSEKEKENLERALALASSSSRMGVS